MRWGELEEDDGEDLDFLFPPKQVIGPDENGIKKVIEYKFNEERMVKITTMTRTRKLANARLSKQAVERRSRSKFGDAVLGSRLTMVSTEEIILERPRPPGTKAEEPEVAGDSFAQLSKGAVLMVRRTCGKKGDHCPYKDLAPELEDNKPVASESTTVASGPSKGTYVPPSMRAGAERTGTDMRRRNDENSGRVTNLSEDTREPDLDKLFKPFVNREEARRAINNLNGYCYDNLILRVEWATPRAEGLFSPLYNVQFYRRVILYLPT